MGWFATAACAAREAKNISGPSGMYSKVFVSAARGRATIDALYVFPQFKFVPPKCAIGAWTNQPMKPELAGAKLDTLGKKPGNSVGSYTTGTPTAKKHAGQASKR